MLFAWIFHFHSQIMNSFTHQAAICDIKRGYKSVRKSYPMNFFFLFFCYLHLVVSQFYDTDVNKAYVIQGNAMILKCEIPSFVADFVSVVSWHTDQNETFYPATDYGL